MWLTFYTVLVQNLWLTIDLCKLLWLTKANDFGWNGHPITIIFIHLLQLAQLILHIQSGNLHVPPQMKPQFLTFNMFCRLFFFTIILKWIEDPIQLVHYITAIKILWLTIWKSVSFPLVSHKNLSINKIIAKIINQTIIWVCSKNFKSQGRFNTQKSRF